MNQFRRMVLPGIVRLKLSKRNRIEGMLEQIRRRWCKIMHRSLMFAGGWQSECRRCGLRFDTPWNLDKEELR
jgi:hypothetical protein